MSEQFSPYKLFKLLSVTYKLDDKTLFGKVMEDLEKVITNMEYSQLTPSDVSQVEKDVADILAQNV